MTPHLPRTPLPSGGPLFSTVTKPAPKKPKRSFEEVVGTNWLPKLGAAMMVVAAALLTAYKWELVTSWWNVIGAWGRSAIVFVGGVAMLLTGIRFERNDRYKTLGRAMIGGGWAMTFLLAYAIRHSPSFLILRSDAADLVVLLPVAGAMVWHTLKYNSQTVTGLAFLLGFTAVTINPDPPFNLLAGALLVAGMTVVILRYQWFELEVVGIVASYANHFYWLYQVYEHQGGRAMFPHHGASVALATAYWTIFRVSYLARKISARKQETVSTFAGLLNPILFMAVMKYQGFHPEWAWRFLLIMGAVEFVLGQLPVSKGRRAPFQVLSSLGATLMVAAPLVRGSGNSLEVIWLAGAEAFMFAGILTRERLFRGFAIIISFLVALYALPVRIAPLVQQIVDGRPHHSEQASLVLAIIAAVLYANAHLTRRIWPPLFEEEMEQTWLTALSFVASLFAVGAIYAYVPDNGVAVVLALFVLALSFTGKQAAISALTYQAHWIATVAVIQVIVSGIALETSWHRLPLRVLTFVPVAAALYWSSRFVRLSKALGAAVSSGAYTWAATGLLTVLIWLQAKDWLVAVMWIGLGLLLSLAAQALKRNDFKWQALALVLLAAVHALSVNFGNTSVTPFAPHATIRLLSVSAIALGIYLLARWAPLAQLRPVYTVIGTFLMGLLAFDEAPAPWTAVAWIAIALALALAGRVWKDRALLWQTHLLAALAAGWTLYANFAPQYRGSRVQWMTVGITAVLLYALTWIANVEGVIEDERMCQGYAWAASLLVSWLAWYQLQPIAVSAAWGIFALLLFEFPEFAGLVKIDVGKSAASWRAQAYVALAGGFVHIFYSNFNGGWGPATYSPIALVLIYFYVYWQLSRREMSALEKSFRVDALLAWLGTATLAALARFELQTDTVVIGYAGLVVVTLLVAWVTRRQIFVYQALVLLGVTAFRISMNNFYRLSGSSLTSAIWAIALLACAVPLAFQARKSVQAGNTPRWITAFALHAEQPMFFVPVALLAVLLFLKLSGFRITMSWGIEGLVVFVLALWAKQRSFRLTGLGLVLLATGKIVCWDTWQIADSRRFIALFVVGAILLVLPFLYGRNKEALRDYL
jgi:hypothetical protein